MQAPVEAMHAMDENAQKWADLVAIGAIAKSQGREGEVAVNPLTDHVIDGLRKAGLPE